MLFADHSFIGRLLCTITDRRSETTLHYHYAIFMKKIQRPYFESFIRDRIQRAYTKIYIITENPRMKT